MTTYQQWAAGVEDEDDTDSSILTFPNMQAYREWLQRTKGL
jgi:hypothetical protein